ncbi:hypothetical protein F4861DRAFT_527714 [Xylaria intraflava]|nr:hypothetical protein F4861DRAFT_527714 [Xylaria intraflava]
MVLVYGILRAYCVLPIYLLYGMGRTRREKRPHLVSRYYVLRTNGQTRVPGSQVCCTCVKSLMNPNSPRQAAHRAQTAHGDATGLASMQRLSVALEIVPSRLAPVTAAAWLHEGIVAGRSHSTAFDGLARIWHGIPSMDMAGCRKVLYGIDWAGKKAMMPSTKQ